MQDIIDAIQQLVNGYPKQATATIDMLVNTNKLFFNQLADIITGEIGYQLGGKMLTAGIVILNTLTIRCKNKMGIMDFLFMVLESPKISFQNKKLLSPSLSQLLAGSCTSHKQILTLKSHLIQNQSLCCTPLYLQSIINSTNITQPLKIQSIIQLFQQALFQINYYTGILDNCFNQTKIKIKIKNNDVQIDTACVCFGRIKYFVDLLVGIFQTVSIGQQGCQYQKEAIGIIVDSQQLAKLLFKIIQWKTFKEQYNYLWLQDLKLNNKQTIQLHQINNMKQKAFKIICLILQKTNPNFNFLQHCHKLFSYIPQLCLNVLKQIIKISTIFGQLDQQNLIGSLCDSMIKFLAECLKFQDLIIIFSRNTSLQQLIRCIICYLKIRVTDINGQQDAQYFSNFLQGFAGQINLNQINRYAITDFIQACCNKFDSFPSALFTTCYNNLIHKLQQILPKNQNFYHHLYILYQTMSDKQLQQIKNLEVSECLIGFLCLQKQIQMRKDFKHAIQQLMIVMDIEHFKGSQVIMIYYILGTNLDMFQTQSMLNASNRILKMAFDCAERDQGCAIMCLQFINRFYHKFLAQHDMTHDLNSKYINLAQNVIWHQLIKCFQLNNISQNQNYYSMLNELISMSMVSTINPLNKLMVKTVGNYLLTQIPKFVFIILKRCCEKELKLLNSKSHDQLLLLRINQVIIQCLEILDWAIRIQSQIPIKKIAFDEYSVLVIDLIKGVMLIVNNDQCESQPTVQQVLTQIQILSILILQQQKQYPQIKPSSSLIPQSVFQVVLQKLLNHPFGTPWLICICQFTHRIAARFTLSEIDLISAMIKKSYTNYITNQLKLNELCLFVIVLLNYYQPQNWHTIHQIVRVHMVKLMKIDSQTKIERKKQLIQLGYQSQSIYGLTVIRLFHVYIFGFRMQPNNELLQQILCYFERFIQKYGIIETTHLIIGFKSSYRQMNTQNFNKILDLLLLILNKLINFSNYFGHESNEQARMRKLSQKIGCINADPYQQFRSLIKQLQSYDSNLIQNSKYNTKIRSLMNINTCKGQPRKVYSILKPK